MSPIGFVQLLLVLLLINYMGNKIQISKISIFVMVYSSKTLPTDDPESIFTLSSCVRRQLLLLDLAQLLWVKF